VRQKPPEKIAVMNGDIPGAVAVYHNIGWSKQFFYTLFVECG
jgi:hypothetical protein